MINVHGQTMFDRPLCLDRDLGLVIESSEGDNANVARGEFGSG